MAIEILIKANDSHNFTKKGFAVYMKDSPCVWGKKEGLPNFIRIRIADATLEELRYLKSTKLMTDYDCTQVANTVTIRAKSKTSSGLNEIDRTKVAGFVGTLGGTNVTIGTDSVSFKIPVKMTLDDIKMELIDKLQEVFELRRYYFDRDEIDKLAAISKSVTDMTKSEFLALIHDRMTE